MLTGLSVQKTWRSATDTVNYDIELSGRLIQIFICNSCKNKINIQPKDYYIIKGLIANNKWPERSIIVSKDCKLESLPKDAEKIIMPYYLETADYPKKPLERMDNLFLNLFKMQEIDGHSVPVNFLDEVFLLKNYFRTPEECFFYMKGLVENGYIKYMNVGNSEFAGRFTITHLGLNKAIELSENGHNSNEFFIAMAFKEETKPYRDAIKNSLKRTGYKAIIIDEEHLKSDKTIPDGILSGIKKSKFCVADFSHHRNGVYFESGYALGLGKPVIYLCEEKEFENAHFDIKQLQHIIYKTPEELEKKLVEKIEVWI
jgi:hypothetical protein